ncbi:MAG: hypothetical protein JSS95_04455 [Acidobacteria bacterium]|nr:hypothetical protein [Acidobacteriota bacterium]
MLHLDLSAADAVWVATALLHREHPRTKAFSVQEIVHRVEVEHLSSRQPMTIYQHANQHCVANRPPNNARLCMLMETPDGLRRLYRRGDPVDPHRIGARRLPEASSLSADYRKLLDWYAAWESKNAGDLSLDPILALAGTWTFGDADRYVRELREGWE